MDKMICPNVSVILRSLCAAKFTRLRSSHMSTYTHRFPGSYGCLDPRRCRVAQPTPPLCPQARHTQSYHGDDSSRPLTAVERDGQSAALGRGGTETRRFAPGGPRR